MSNLRTGGQVIADHLAANDVEYVAGIPGHGCLPMVDAFMRASQTPTFLQVRHEQSAAHLADAYFRIARKPMAVMTSIGPGAVNTAVGIATAYVDSSSMLVFTGDVHTYMFGRGVLQEVDRKAWADLTTHLRAGHQTPVAGDARGPAGADHAAGLSRWRLVAVPGPVLISVPMDVQADAADVPEACDSRSNCPRLRRPSASAVTQIRAALADAQTSRPPRRRRRRPKRRPHAGSGRSPSTSACPVVATYQAKGVLPEDHPLYGALSGIQGHRHRQRPLSRGGRHPRHRLPLRR